MKSNQITKLVTAALMSAISCVTTMAIAVPTPGGGFIHPGDGFVLLSGIILGPLYGGLAAGIGSMMADILLGYTSFAPATLIIKCLAAVAGALVFRIMKDKMKQHIVPVIFAAIVGGIVVTPGYFIFESFILGLGPATSALNIPMNLIQNAFGILVSVLLFPLLHKAPQIRNIMDGQ